MRILIINTLYRPLLHGGAEKSVALLAEALVRRGDVVSVITLHPGPTSATETLNGVKVYRIPLDNLYWPYGPSKKPERWKRFCWHVKDVWNKSAARRVGAILDIERPDVVHTNQLEGFSVAVWAEIKRRQIRLVHTLRGYYPLCPRSTMFKQGTACTQQCRGCHLFTYNRRKASSCVDELVSNSEYVLSQHIDSRYFPNARRDVIFNIADLKMATGLGQGVSGNTIRFGFIGSICPEKGIEILLRACGLLAGQNWELRIAGEGVGSYPHELRMRYTDARLSWLGFAQAQDYFNSIDVNIVPSLFPDPLPRTLIETYAAGKSAICAESGGIPEIASLGRTYATYPAQSVTALARLMDNAMADPLKWRSGGFSDESASQRFAEVAVVDKYRAVYQGSRNKVQW